MPKYYAIENSCGVVLGGCRDKDPIPSDAIIITNENYEAAIKIHHKHDRKIENGVVMERTAAEKEEIYTRERFLPEKYLVLWKALRRSYRLIRHPFKFRNKQIMLELGDLRSTAQNIPFSTWDNFIRDAVTLESAGLSILPFKVMATDETTILIDKKADLLELYYAMIKSNKKILEDEITIRESISKSYTYSEIKAVRAENSLRGKD